jgi:replication-associated recombination protein RarA
MKKIGKLVRDKMAKINWKEKTTLNGYAADEVISALQKDIRRGNKEEAAYWAYELCLSGDEFHGKLWERLFTIAVEDISFGNEHAAILIRTLYEAFQRDYDNIDDKYIQAFFAATFLASCPKDRYIDELKNYFKKFDIKKQIPDYALDKHTKRGKEMGRGSKHFWEEGTKLFPELKGRDKQYLDKIMAKQEEVD